MHSNPDSGQGFELKHRIVGALLLIVAAVVVLSIVLRDGEQAQRPPADLPAAVEEPLPDLDRRSFVSTVQPLDGVSGERQAEAPAEPPAGVAEVTPLDESAIPPAEPEPAPVAAQPEPEAVAAPDPEPVAEPEVATPEPAAEPVPEPAPEQVSAADPAPDEARSAPEVGWVVRVGTFANPENADRLGALLREHGFEPRTSQIETGSGPATRVWVGPVETRVEAARLRTELERVTGEEGLIASYP